MQAHWLTFLSFIHLHLVDSLLQQDMSEVLDAMFERKVEAGDLVIRQGDDGDYFYVIEK